MMTNAQLLALDQLCGSTAAQVQTADPDLAKVLAQKIADQRKTAVLAGTDRCTAEDWFIHGAKQDTC